jgi:murein DD-endopeptidase MepM/ murein hydrolase activator NlpD
MNPPGHPRLAFDFLAVDENKNPYKGTSLLRHIFSTITVENTHAWSKPVYAVLPGTVVSAYDGAPDRRPLSMVKDLLRLLLFGPKVAPPFSNLGGNYVILDCGDVYPLYAHLQNGSVKVHPGQVVRTGDLLGAVGNSGSSLQPHLHFQVMTSPDPFPLFQNLLPVAISEVQCKRGGNWDSELNHELKNGEHLKFHGFDSQRLAHL